MSTKVNWKSEAEIAALYPELDIKPHDYSLRVELSDDSWKVIHDNLKYSTARALYAANRDARWIVGMFKGEELLAKYS